MKNIKKITKAVAGSALLVGATLAGGAAMASAQDSGSSGNLGDYPAPFVDEDGEVDTSIVVGESAKSIDVVGGINIAGSLGQAAMSEETVSAEGGSFGWSASDGVSLDTRNDALYFGDNIDNVRETLTEDDLQVLEEVTFRDDSGTTTDITSYLNVGTQGVNFDNNPDMLDNEDPQLYVNLPSEGDVSDTNHLFSLQANMEDTVNFTSEDVKGEDIELFGRSYTVSAVSGDNEVGDDQLVLFGASQQVDLETGESTTVTINENEHTIELVAVTGSGTTKEAALRIDGDLRSETEDETFNIDGEDVRIDQIVKTGGSDSSQGVVQLDIGSEEVKLDAGNPVQDSDDDDIDGTYVEVNGATGYSVGNGVSSIEVFVGSADDDTDAVAAGESFSHDLFENVAFRFGGLNPNAAEGGDDVGEFEVSTSGDEDVQVSLMSEGESASISFMNADDGDNSVDDADRVLADEDRDEFVLQEGANMTENQYFATDAGDFAHMWELTDVNYDSADSTVDVRDVVTGDTVEVDLDDNSGLSDYDYAGTEIIGGQKYYFHIDSAEGVAVTYGDDAGKEDTGATGTNGAHSIFTAIDTDHGGAVAFYDEVNLGNLSSTSDSTYRLELPSTESTDAKTATIDASSVTSGDGNTYTTTFSPSGQELTYRAVEEQDTGEIYVGLNASASVPNDGSQTATDHIVSAPHVLSFHPEDDSDTESVYAVTASADTNNEELQIDSPSYYGTGSYSTTALEESDDEVDAAYDAYGAYSEYDSDEQGGFMLHVPMGQAVAGAAFTDADGSLSAGGSSGSVTSMMPTGWDDHGALDSDSNIGSMKQNSNLILVGGPAVNTLVDELAQEDKTWAGSDYSEGDQVLHHVPDAFSQGNDALVVAGYSGQDTRAAANYLANYEDNQDELSGNAQLNLATQ